MIKSPASSYKPGRRGREWLKLKRAIATLDVVVTAVEVGHGKRRKLLSDYTFAVRRSEDDDELLNIGKAYSGLTDVELAEMTEWSSRPLDDTNRGKYFFEVIDAAGGTVVFSRGFSSIYGEWETTEEAKDLDRTFSESLRFPAPAKPVGAARRSGHREHSREVEQTLRARLLAAKSADRW